MMNVDYIEKVQKIFFKAMIKGWASDGQKSYVPGMPFHWDIDFCDGDFRVLDRYCVSQYSLQSAGTTTIWYRDNPIWFMSYGGFYNKHVVRFLKRALLSNYESEQFLGGRGPEVYREGELVYKNKLTLAGFLRFEGSEEIYNENTGKTEGEHSYLGVNLA